MKSSTIWLAFIWQCNLNILSYLILGTTLKWWYFVSLFLRLEYWSLERLINTPFVEPRFEFICLAQSPNAYPLNHTICVFVIQLCAPTNFPGIPVSLERNTEVFRQDFLWAPSTLLISTGGYYVFGLHALWWDYYWRSISFCN